MQRIRFSICTALVVVAGLARTAAGQNVPISVVGAPTIPISAMAGGASTSIGGTVRISGTFAQPFIGSGTSGSITSQAGYWYGAVRDGDETICDFVSGVTYRFLVTRRLSTRMDLLGTLGCLRVRRTDAAHPSATPVIDGTSYWTITGMNAVGGPPVGYSLTLTFPQPGFATPGACRWTGETWDCSRTAADATSVTRSGVTQLFSDWTVSSSAVPVELLGFTVE